MKMLSNEQVHKIAEKNGLNEAEEGILRLALLIEAKENHE